MPRVNIYDISRHAGVSIATVSRVLNNSPHVSEETRRKVMKVIDGCGYVPNAFARGLGLNTMKTIGLLCPDAADPYLARALACLEHAFRQKHYDCLLSCTNRDLAARRQGVELLTSRHVDGMVLMGSTFIEENSEDNAYIRQAATNVPVVLLNGSFQCPNVFCVLCDDERAMKEAMNQLLDGASQLKAGAAQLAAGSLALLDGANQLDSGLGQLTEGLDTLTSNNAALTSGAQQVADGVLDSANQTLMENGLIDTPMTWDTYEAVIDDILSLGDKTLAAGRKKMVRTIWEQAPQFKASQLDIALYLAATRTDHDLEAALRLMQSFSPDFIMGWLKKLTDSDAQQKIHDELVYQTANSEDMASVRALKENLGQIQFFVSSVGQYADGVAAAADGAHTAKAGSAQLAGGASALYDGVLQLQNGTDQLNGGLVQFNEEGISQLTGALDADQLHALQTVVEEMTSRLADYTSFAGVPEGASSRVKFLYKTAETPAETAPVETTADTASEGNFFLRLWHRLLALFGL